MALCSFSPSPPPPPSPCSSSPPPPPPPPPSPLLLVTLLVFGLVALLLLTVPSEDVHQSPGFSYGIVVDAGSSHTALYIYRWSADKHNGTGVVVQHNQCHIKGGGISSYAGERGAAGRSLETCLEQAVKDIPAEKHPQTPVYLGATAGMRLLNLSRPQEAAQILQEVGYKIQSYPFDYRGAAILSSQEEGAYGWVTVNYLSENFIKYGFVGRWFNSGRPTVGALDLGGASTQITFATQEEVEDREDMMKLHLYGQDFSLYTHSFLCYGRDQVLLRVLAHLLKTQGNSDSVDHPCYPAGHTRTLTLSSIFSSPCTSRFRPTSFDPHSRVTVEGSGRHNLCEANVSQIFSFDHCPFSRCSFDRVFQPNISGSFMAFSAFFYTHSFLQKITGKAVKTLSQLEDATKTVCNMSFTQMLVGAPEEEPRLQDYCTSSVFVHLLLSRGYGFDDSSFPLISFQKKAGDTSVGWALGYMLSLSNLLSAESTEVRKALPLGPWAALVTLCCLLLTTALIIIILQVCDWKNKEDSEGTV